MQFFWNGFSIRFFSLNLRNPAIVGSGQMDLQLQEVERNFPNMSAGVCLAAAEGIFHHGGLHSPNSTKPSSQLAYFDLTKSVWTDISTSDSPKLSNHAGFVTEGRYLHLFGGWDGKERTNGLITFDTHHRVWLRPKVVSGFPVGGGLSNHTATPLLEGGALIVGRLGSLRMQRQNTTVLLAKGDLLNTIEFSLVPTSISSRSGHTATVANGSLLIVGGREDPEGLKPEWVHGYNFLSSSTEVNVRRLPLKQSEKLENRRHCVSFVDSNGSVILVGGEKLPTDRKPFSLKKDVAIRKDRTLVGFNALSSMFYHYCVIMDGNVYILGGFDINKACQPNSALYKVFNTDL